MRVLFLNRYAGAFGGVEAYVRRAALGLSERGAECLLGRVEDRGADIGGYLAPFAGAFTAGDEAGLAEEASRIAPDVVFLHKLGDTRAFLPLRGRSRLVRYVHDHDLCCPRRHKYYAWGGAICSRPAGALCALDAGFVERRGAGLAFRSPAAFFQELEANRALDLLLVGSRYMRDELVANGFDAARVAVLPPSTPPAPAEASARHDAAPPFPRPFLLYVGQLIRGKGVDVLLDAFALLRRERTDVGLVVAGAGNADASLRDKASRLGLAGSVRFLGMVGEGELDALYYAAAALAVPSRWPEPFGMVGLEAMRRSLPVAASAAGGIPDWLEDGVTGFLAKPGDPRSLAAAISRILDDPALARRLGQAGRAKAEKEFSFSCSMDQLALYLSGG